MPVIPSGDLELLRAEGHTSVVYASFLKPDTLWWGQVNSGALDRGDTAIPWDNGGSGGGGDWPAVEAYQTIWVGTTPGGNEIGRVRLQAFSTGDAGVTGGLTVAPNVIPWADDLYLTWKHNYEFWPMYPYIDPITEVFYKDGNIAYTDENVDSKPVVVVDWSQRAGFIKNGELTFFFDASGSYATADGAAITTYAMTIYPTTGATVTINAGTGIGRVVITNLTQEYFWCKFTVTDDNGKTQISYRCIFAHDPDRTGSTFPHHDFTINQLAGAWERGGWYTQLVASDNVSLNDVPDGTFAVLWAENGWGIGTDIAYVKRDSQKLFVNPKLGYTMVPNGGNCDITVTFESGVLVDGVPAANGTSMALDLSVNGGAPVPKTDTTTDGILTLSHTFVGEPLNGTILAEDIGNTRTIIDGTYIQWATIAAEGEWPSIMKAFPQSILVGYVRKENLTFSTASQGGTGQDTLEITTIEDVLRKQFMFSISLAARPSPSTWYEYDKSLTIGRACHHIWKWHSTLLEIADVKGLLDNLDGRAYAEFENGTLYTMPDTMASQHGIRAHIVCNKKGQIYLTQDVQLLPDTDRAALDVIANVTHADRSGEIGILRDYEDRVALVYASGLVFSETFSLDENGDLMPDVEPYCAMAPGELPSGWGEGTVNLERQVLASSAHLRQIAGRTYAKENNLYPEIRIRYHGNYLEYLDFDIAEFWEIDLGVGDTIKELAIPDLNLILRSVAARVDVDAIGGTIRADTTFEPEMEAELGVLTDCPSGPTDLGGEDPIIPAPAELPGAVITASSGEYLPAGSNAWTERTTESTQDIIQDPFWRTRQATVDPTYSILLKCGSGHVKRSTNAGVSWSDITPSTDPPNDASDSPAPTKTSVTYFRLDASIINQGEFTALARWQNSADEWRSWIAFTDDDGATWSWKSLFAPPSPSCISIGTENPAFESYAVNFDSGTANNPIIQVDTDTYVMSYIQSDDDRCYVIAFTMSGDTPTFGTRVYTGGYDFGAGSYGKICKVDTNKFAVIVFTSLGGGDYDHVVRIGTVTGNAISFGGSYGVRTQDELDYLSIGLSHLAIGSPTTTEIVVFSVGEAAVDSGGCAATSDWRAQCTWGSISGSVVTFDTDTCDAYTVRKWYPIVSGYNWALDVNHYVDSLGVKMGSNVLFIWSRGPGTRYFYAVGAGSGSGNLGTAQTIGTYLSGPPDWRSPDVYTIQTLSATKALFMYNEYHEWTTGNGNESDNELHGCVITLSTLTPSIGSDNHFETNYWYYDNMYLAIMDSTTAVFAAHLYDANCSAFTLLDIDGDDITIVKRCAQILDDGHVFAPFPYTSEKFMFVHSYFTSPSYEAFLYTDTHIDDIGCIDYQSRALGVQIDKLTGAKAWATLHNGTELELLEIALSTLAISNRTSLGNATEAQVDAETYIAWPFAAFGDDDSVYVFGRMNDPDGLGDPAHAILTVDGGSSFSLLEDGFSTDIISALHQYGDLLLIARDSGNNTKIYLWDGAAFQLKSTSLLNAGIKVSALAFDYRDYTIVLGSNAANSIMVVLSVYPYTDWIDITGDHPIGNSVFAVEIL